MGRKQETNPAPRGAVLIKLQSDLSRRHSYEFRTRLWRVAPNRYILEVPIARPAILLPARIVLRAARRRPCKSGRSEARASPRRDFRHIS